MKTKNLIIYIIICLIIIAGLAVWEKKGFKSELQYAARKQIQLAINTEIKTSDIEQITSEVLGNTNFLVQEIESFGNSVAIVSREITEEQRNSIVEKFNEKYGSELKAEDIEIEKIPFTRIKDIIKPFVIPGVTTLAMVALYFLFRFRNIGWKKVLLKTLATPIVAELLIFSLMSITRIPVGRFAIAVGIGMYASCIIILTNIFENQRNAYIENMQNNN